MARLPNRLTAPCGICCLSWTGSCRCPSAGICGPLSPWAFRILRDHRAWDGGSQHRGDWPCLPLGLVLQARKKKLSKAATQRNQQAKWRAFTFFLNFFEVSFGQPESFLFCRFFDLIWIGFVTCIWAGIEGFLVRVNDFPSAAACPSLSFLIFVMISWFFATRKGQTIIPTSGRSSLKINNGYE